MKGWDYHNLIINIDQFLDHDSGRLAWKCSFGCQVLIIFERSLIFSSGLRPDSSRMTSPHQVVGWSDCDLTSKMQFFRACGAPNLLPPSPALPVPQENRCGRSGIALCGLPRRERRIPSRGCSTRRKKGIVARTGHCPYCVLTLLVGVARNSKSSRRALLSRASKGSVRGLVRQAGVYVVLSCKPGGRGPVSRWPSATPPRQRLKINPIYILCSLKLSWSAPPHTGAGLVSLRRRACTAARRRLHHDCGIVRDLATVSLGVVRRTSSVYGLGLPHPHWCGPRQSASQSMHGSSLTTTSRLRDCQGSRNGVTGSGSQNILSLRPAPPTLVRASSVCVAEHARQLADDYITTAGLSGISQRCHWEWFAEHPQSTACPTHTGAGLVSLRRRACTAAR